MRTLVDLTAGQVEALDRVARRRERSRAALIREAIDAYLGRQGVGQDDEAFGAWERIDGLAYEARVRGEW